VKTCLQEIQKFICGEERASSYMQQAIFIYIMFVLNIYNSNQSLGYLYYKNGEAKDDSFIW